MPTFTCERCQQRSPEDVKVSGWGSLILYVHCTSCGCSKKRFCFCSPNCAIKFAKESEEFRRFRDDGADWVKADGPFYSRFYDADQVPDEAPEEEKGINRFSTLDQLVRGLSAEDKEFRVTFSRLFFGQWYL